MKSSIRVLMLVICLAVAMSFAACKQAERGDNKPTAVPAATDAPAGKTTDAPTAQATDVHTDAPTEAPKPSVEAGMMVYYEDFSGYGDIDDTYKTARALNVINLTPA